MSKVNYRWFALLGLVALLAITMLACAPSVTPTATPTKAAEPAKTAEPAKPAEPTKPPAASPTAPPKALDPIKLGFQNSFSGYMAPMGTPERDSVLMLEEKVNKEGGINGRPLKVIVYDDESDETKGVLAIKKAINEDKVLGIIGTSASGIAMAQVPVAEDAQVPWITMQSAKSTILPNRKWIFKLPLSEAGYLEAFYRWAKGENYTKVALINQGAGFGREARKYIEETAPKQGITIVVKEEYGPTDTDIKPQLTKVKASDAQVLIVYGAEAAGAIAVRQAKEMGLTIPIIGPESLTLPAIMGNKELRDGLEGFYIMGHKPDVWDQLPDADPQKTLIKALSDQLKAKYGANRVLSMWESVANDAFNVMVNAIKKANPDPAKVDEARSKVRDAIEQTKDFAGTTSVISYSPAEHEIWEIKAKVISQIKDGKFKLVKTFQ
ncbi:MAG: ABC transporter substrate-binding protein [Dehalococcoidia bacterium]|nr:ABC transporter substrate-binding protein [Dehalococcoidia bacterium]